MSGEVSTVRAVVRAFDAGDVLLEVEQGGCGRCHEKGGCGGQNLTQMFCSGPKAYRLRDPGGLSVGDRVKVAIAAGAVRRSANLAYGLPLAGLIGGAVVGMQVAADAGAMAGGAAGVLLAWLLVRNRVRAHTGNPEFQPYIVSRSPT